MEKKLKGIYKKWRSRRFWIALAWGVFNYATTYLQPILELDKDLVHLLIEKSAWIAGLLIVGLSGTSAVRDYVKNRFNNNQPETTVIQEEEDV